MPNLVKKQLEMTAIVSRTFDDLEIGVLADGTAFLTGSALAAVCGVDRSVVNRWANEFDANSGKTRDEALYRLLQAQQYEGDSLFIKTRLNGQEVNAFPEAVCMAILEYYAFDAERNSDRALHNYRRLARAGIRAFVYSALGYSPNQQIPGQFKSYLDRVMLNRVPNGMYSCFSETAHIVLTSIQAGLIVDDHTVPDISVGKAWSTYWKSNNLAARFGERTKHSHSYPADYPQSAANEIIEAYVYPIDSLGEFRSWLDREYLPQRYPNYLAKKVKTGALPASQAELLLATLVPPQIPANSEV